MKVFNKKAIAIAVAVFVVGCAQHDEQAKQDAKKSGAATPRYNVFKFAGLFRVTCERDLLEPDQTRMLENEMLESGSSLPSADSVPRASSVFLSGTSRNR